MVSNYLIAGVALPLLLRKSSLYLIKRAPPVLISSVRFSPELCHISCVARYVGQAGRRTTLPLHPVSSFLPLSLPFRSFVLSFFLQRSASYIFRAFVLSVLHVRSPLTTNTPKRERTKKGGKKKKSSVRWMKKLWISILAASLRPKGSSQNCPGTRLYTQTSYRASG